MKTALTFIANLLLFMSLTTLLFAFCAYLAFKLKQRRKPIEGRSSQKSDVKVFEEYRPKDVK